VPDEVVEYARRLTLKTIGGIVAGARFEPAPRMLELVRAKGLPAGVGDVKFSYQHCLGAMLADGNLSFRNIQAIDDDRYAKREQR
jgi:hypothetical protein